ncbi:ABC transporter ATP-binding protein [Massilia eurypsychrophila]|jgi:multiple sugar transport system ATP-binding protein|uniref:ABC transporter ATP-binding protein n=1 Tax=Massilia eurypsychrophila TaxID=1485217 RepID=UPI000C196A5F|nr:ABC transporter ATP-binding protein [Massilia eurypsychrophila]
MANVALRKLSITLGGNQVIRGLDLDIADGEFLVLLGPSGCGKSTLLHSIAGLNDIDGGSVEIGGRDMRGVDPSQRGIGMVFQSYALYPTMTVEKNMSFGARIAGLPKAQIAERVARAAAMLQLGELLKRKPAQLSGGQRQRVAIGRALVREAAVFLFDEPLSNLDAKLRAELRRELKLLHQNLGATMIYVTHDQVEAMTLASRIVVMREGQVQQIGTPADVYERPANLFVAGFLGAPAMNFIAGEVDAHGFFRAGPLHVKLRQALPQRAVLGVRPEHIRIEAGGALAATVALVEPMGNHQVVWLACAGQQLSVVVQDSRHFTHGQAVSLNIDAARVSLFDPDSGKALSYAVEQALTLETDCI